MKKTEELVVITKTYDLILWSCNHTSRLCRQLGWLTLRTAGAK